MITFLTTAKPFIGDDKIRQYWAIRSWMALDSDIEVLLFGDGEGYGQASEELGLKWIPNIPVGPGGAPRIDAMFQTAEKMAKHQVKAYVNCDIVLLPDLIDAVKAVNFKEYLLVAQRWNLPGGIGCVFGSEWVRDVKEKLKKEGSKGSICAIDMFLFKGAIWEGLPPLYVGRAGYDNFLIFHCRSRGVPVIDASKIATLVHQGHDYSHVGGGKTFVWEGDEASHNYSMSGGLDRLLTIEDADWIFRGRRLRRNICRGNWRRYLLISRVIFNANSAKRKRLPSPLEVCAEFYWRIKKWPGNKLLIAFKFPGWLLLRAVGRR